MQSEFYKEYMKSEEWRKKELERLAIDDFKCCMCGRTDGQTRYGLQVHHTTYKRLGQENVYTDLVSLCGRCHKWIHNYNSRITSEKAVEE